MPETVSYNQVDKIVEVRSSGHLTILELTTSKEGVERLFSENEVNGIFIDVRDARSMPTSFSLVDSVEATFQSTISQETKFALLMTQTEGEVVREMRLVEIAGRHRGMPFRLFDDEEKARQWLLDSQ